jgi:hypothetical protein
LEAIGLIAGPDTYNDQEQYVFMADLSVVLSDSLNLRAAYSARNREVESVDPIRNNNSYFFNNIRTLNYQERDEGSEGWKLDALYRYGGESFRGSFVAGYEAQSITKDTLFRSSQDEHGIREDPKKGHIFVQLFSYKPYLSRVMFSCNCSLTNPISLSLDKVCRERQKQPS